MAVLRALRAFLLASSLISCGLVVSFDDYGTSGKGPGPGAVPPTYVVRGNVSGLEGAKATLHLNGAPHEVSDGAFVFPERLAEGAAYAVTVPVNPAGHVCRVTGGSGAIVGSDVTTIDVRCPSTDATLESLTLSPATLSPAFSPTELTYAARFRIASAPFMLTKTSVTITAKSKHPAAKIVMAGKTLASGKASAPIPLTSSGPTPFDVSVEAPSGKTAHYTVVLTADVDDYVKPSDVRDNQAFGADLAISGDTMVVGAPRESTKPFFLGREGAVYTPPGAAYVFRRSGGTWKEEAHLTSENLDDGAFGTSVAISGDTVVVGAPEAEGQSGSTYVYRRAGTVWSLEAYVRASNPFRATVMHGAAFGTAVAIRGDDLAVGAPYDPSKASGIDGDQSDTSVFVGRGAVYTFQRSGTTWTQTAYVKPEPSTIIGGERFGARLALSPTHLAVTSNRAPTSSVSQGPGLYFYAQAAATWAYETYVVPLSAPLGFGPLTFSGATLAAGSDDAVEVWTRVGGSWTREARLVAPIAGVGFGGSLGLDSDLLAVGAHRDASNARGVGGDPKDTSAPDDGAAHLFRRAAGTWSQVAYVKATTKKPAGAQHPMWFGGSVAVAGTTIAVGAVGDRSKSPGINGDPLDTSKIQAGAVFVY